VKGSVAAQWTALDRHFRHHADAHAVARMWKSQTNEDGKRLSQFERDALIERHCELFGIWPDQRRTLSRLSHHKCARQER
jgi:hypothetical protein